MSNLKVVLAMCQKCQFFCEDSAKDGDWCELFENAPLRECGAFVREGREG